MTKTNLRVDRVDGLDGTAAVLSFGALIFARYVDSAIPLVPLACHRVQKKIRFVHRCELHEASFRNLSQQYSAYEQPCGLPMEFS